MKYIFNRFKNWYYNLSIVKKIGYTNTITIVILTIIMAVFANRLSSQIMINNTISNSNQNLKLIIQALDGIYNDTERIANIIIANNDVQQSLKKERFMDYNEKIMEVGIINAFIDNVLYPRDKVSSCVIKSKSGFTFNSNNVNTTKIKEVKQNINLDRNHSVWTGLHEVGYEKWKDKVSSVTFNKNVIDGSSGDILGIIELNVYEKIISNCYSQIKYGKTGYFLITDENGNIISSKNEEKLYKNISNESYFSLAQKNDFGGSVLKIHGESYLVTSEKYERNKWIIIGIVPLKELISDNEKVTRMIFLTGLISIILGMISSIFISRAISKPIIKLSKSMAKVGTGDFDVTIKHKGNDEIGILSVSFNKMTSEISNLIEQLYTEQKKKRKFELMAIQSQINPHFLYNTLDSICSLVQMNLNKDAFRMVKTLAIFYRNVLSKGRNVISIKEELENVESYLVIQKIRYGDKFDYTLSVNQDILSGRIIKLSMQPIVENAIYHGIRQKHSNGKIEITGEIEGENIIISIADDGVGMEEATITKIFSKVNDALEEKNSFGLISVDERIKLYFGQQYGIKINSKIEVGTKIDIILPRSSQKEDDYQL